MTTTEKVYAVLHEAIDCWSLERQIERPHPLAKQRTQMLHSLAVQEIERWQRTGRRERLGRTG